MRRRLVSSTASVGVSATASSDSSAAASARARRRRVERVRDGLVVAGGRDGEMAGAFFDVDVQTSETSVEAASPVERHRRVARRREERVREADPVAVELEDAAVLRPLDVLDRAGFERFQ